LAKCDALDGATDGLVQDVAACRTAFSLQRDVPTCTAGRDGSCLTGAQKTAIGKIFSGPTTSNGERIYASFPYDAGLAQPGNKFWEFTAPLFLDSGAVGIIFKVPPANPTGFNGPAFTLGADLDALAAGIVASNTLYTESAMEFMTPPRPTRMEALRDRGGKIMVVHGVSDPIFSYDDSEAWFRGLDAANEGRGANFARLFPVPGMGHCRGGPSTDRFDALGALVDWVEQGRQPERLVASAQAANPDRPANWSPDRTRPLCAFPLVARYKGSGSLESAASFECRP
ncbi:MAG TPA: tannase/feruloyl esterase family alpha/beta hydrolase, partial [Ramlibacter sp.]